MTVIHSENVLLENIYVNSTDYAHPVGFDFSSLNVSVPTTRITYQASNDSPRTDRRR